MNDKGKRPSWPPDNEAHRKPATLLATVLDPSTPCAVLPQSWNYSLPSTATSRTHSRDARIRSSLQHGESVTVVVDFPHDVERLLDIRFLHPTAADCTNEPLPTPSPASHGPVVVVFSGNSNVFPSCPSSGCRRPTRQRPRRPLRRRHAATESGGPRGVQSAPRRGRLAANAAGHPRGSAQRRKPVDSTLLHGADRRCQARRKRTGEAGAAAGPRGPPIASGLPASERCQLWRIAAARQTFHGDVVSPVHKSLSKCSSGPQIRAGCHGPAPCLNRPHERGCCQDCRGQIAGAKLSRVPTARNYGVSTRLFGATFASQLVARRSCQAGHRTRGGPLR